MSTYAASVAARSRRVRARRRRTARLVIVLVLAALVVWGGVRVSQAVAGATRPAGVMHVVQPGETVWQIAVARYGSSEHDVRLLVDAVLRANGMTSAALVPGQRLLLPAQPD